MKVSTTIFVVACLILFTGCRETVPTGSVTIEKESSFFGYRNVREYLKANIRFRCRPIKRGNNYSSLLVGCPASPYTGTPAMRLRLPDGTVVDTGDLDIRVLMAKDPSPENMTGKVFYDTGGPSMDLYGPWPDGTQHLQINSWNFYLHDNRLISFRVYYRTERWRYHGEIPAIGKSGEKTLFPFPMTQEQVIHVLGKPDRIREYLEE